MSRKGNRFIFLILTTIILSYVGCEIYTDITSTADASTDFSKYQTFAWVSDKTDTSKFSPHDEIVISNLKKYIETGFFERGYRLSLDTPDVFLKVRISNKEKERIITYPVYPYPLYPFYSYPYYFGYIYYYPYEFNYYYRHHPFYYFPPNYFTQKYEYVEGAIILDIYDKRSNKIVWSATAKGEIYNSKYIDKDLQSAVEEMMRNYPVKPVRKITDAVHSDNIY